MSGNTTTSSTSGTLIGAGIVVLTIAAIGFASSQGWFGAETEPSDSDTGDDFVHVTWTVLWGQLHPTGEVYADSGKPKRDLLCDERDLTITTYVNGDATVHDQYDSDANERCTWRWHQAVPRGAELRMLVEEGSPGGTPMNERWKMCQIDVDDHMALPNGWAIFPQGGDCEVWGAAV